MPCEECSGDRVVLRVDEGACSSVELRANLQRYEAQQESLAQMRAEEAAERRLGA